MVDEQSFSAGDFGRRLFRLGQNWRRGIDVRMRQFGLTDATWRPLLHLGRFGDGMRQTDLAAALDIEAPSLVRLLDALENAGLVERREDKDDRRSKIVQLTETGRQAFAQSWAEYVTINDEVVAGISAADLASCNRVFAQIERNMTQAAPPRSETKS